MCVYVSVKIVMYMNINIKRKQTKQTVFLMFDVDFKNTLKIEKLFTLVSCLYIAGCTVVAHTLVYLSVFLYDVNMFDRMM